MLLICQCKAVKIVGYLIKSREAGRFHTCTCNRAASHSGVWIENEDELLVCKGTYSTYLQIVSNRPRATTGPTSGNLVRQIFDSDVIHINTIVMRKHLGRVTDDSKSDFYLTVAGIMNTKTKIRFQVKQ